MKTALRILVIVGAILFGVLPQTFGPKFNDVFPMMIEKYNETQIELLWGFPYYINILFGGLALITGGILYIDKLQYDNNEISNNIKSLYAFSLVLTAVTGIYLAFFTFSDWTIILGYAVHGALMLYTTIYMVLPITNENIKRYQSMIYSYALSLSVITFNIWNPILSFLLKNGEMSYQLAVWESWIPNLFIAMLIIKNKSKNA